MFKYIVFLAVSMLTACAKEVELPEPSITLHCADVSGNLAGSWASACEPSQYSGVTPIAWKATNLVISAETAMETINTYNESTCSSSPTETVVVSATYTLGDAVQINDYPHVQMDFALSSASSTSGDSFPSPGTIFKRLVFMGGASSYGGLMICNSTPINGMGFRGIGSSSGVILGGDSSSYPTSANSYFFMKQ